MIKLFNLMLLLILSGFFTMASAAQTCLNESQIPASTPTGQFVDHGNGTVTDSNTGLMWAKCSEGLSGSDCATGAATTLTWQEALDRAYESALAGYSDWRLPNINELHSIIEVQCTNPAINLSLFPNTLVNYWSASPDGHFFAFYIAFFRGGSSNLSRIANLYVRLVRSGL